MLYTEGKHLISDNTKYHFISPLQELTKYAKTNKIALDRIKEANGYVFIELYSKEATVNLGKSVKKVPEAELREIMIKSKNNVPMCQSAHVPIKQSDWTRKQIVVVKQMSINLNKVKS
jgi:hypothetical protein